MIDFKIVNSNEIKYEDTIFNISTIQEDKNLFTSLQKSGIMTPLLCYKINTDLFLFDGFKRINWAIKNKVENIPVAFTKIDNLKTAFLNLIDFKYDNKNNSAITRAKLISISQKNFAEDMDRELLKRSILSKRKGDAELFALLESLPIDLKLYLEAIEASPSQLLPLIRLKATVGENIIHTLAQPLEMNANQLRKTLDNLADIEKQNKVETNSLLEIVTLAEITIPERKKLFFKELDKLRFPDTDKHRTKFNEIKKELFGNRIKVDDNNFDDKDIDISFRIKNKEELEEKAKIIFAAASKSDKLFDFH